MAGRTQSPRSRHGANVLIPMETTRLFVRDLMTVGVVSLQKQTPLQEIARLMVEKDLEAVVILDDEGHAEGYISQEEMLQAYSHPDVQNLKAVDIMREGVPQVAPDIPLTAAAQIMRDAGVRAMFLMHHAGGIKYAAAVITYRHILRHMAAQNDDQLLDLGISAQRKSPLEIFVERRDAARNARNVEQKNIPTKNPKE
jgi:CBS domain-containing protein